MKHTKTLKRGIGFMLALAVCFGATLALPMTAGAAVGIEAEYVPAVGDTVYFGHYPQTSLGTSTPSSGTDGVDWVLSNGTYYKMEPIPWRVLDNTTSGELFLISNRFLEHRIPYHSSGGGITWEESTIRSWLNSTAVGNGFAESGFMAQAFTDSEYAAIINDTVQNPDNPDYSTPGGSNTTDRVFLLSIQEANDLFIDDTDRKVTVTDYSQRVQTGADWWLRSPGKSDTDAAGVDGTGSVFSNGVSVAGLDHFGIRPALKLDLSSVLFTSDASGTSAKSAVGVGDGLSAATSPSGAVKLTVLDAYNATTNPAGQVKPSLTFAGTTNGTSELRFKYANAATGENQYLSCVLTQGSGASEEVKYYGKLANCATAGSGVCSIPTTGLAAGAYTLKIFCEQANGDNYTDFASASIDMTLTVTGNNGTITSFGGTTDSTRPTLTTAAPSGSAEATSGNIVLTFSEAMNPASGVGSVSLKGGSATVSAPGAWSDSNTVYTIPYSGLAGATTYTIGVSGFQDAVGNAMDAVTSGHTFTTVTPPDHTATQTPGTLGEGQDAVFVFNGNYNHMYAIDVQHSSGVTYAFDLTQNGAQTNLSIGDTIVGKAEDSSVKVTLFASWLDTLPAGTYTLTVHFNNDMVLSSGNADFILARTGPTPTPTPTPPAPGDSNTPVLWFSLLGLSALALCSALYTRSKKRKQAEK